jgi:phosphohistidine phosphatase
MLVCLAAKIDLRAMRLMLLRHAKAEKADADMRDHERALNARGKSDAASIGAYLSRHGLAPELAVFSTAKRTRETWEVIAQKFSVAPASRFDDRLYNANAKAILQVIRGVEARAHTLMLIGHNPGLHEFACSVIASGDIEERELLREGLPTAGLAVIGVAGAQWRDLHFHGGRLEHFVTPRSLATADRV